MRAFRIALAVGLFASLLALLSWRASVKPFWHAEIYTILEAELPVATLWRALHDGIDLQPPLNVSLTRGIHLICRRWSHRDPTAGNRRVHPSDLRHEGVNL